METIERDHPQFVEPLILRDVYGMSYDDIAQQIGIPLGHGEGADPPRAQARAAAPPRARLMRCGADAARGRPGAARRWSPPAAGRAPPTPAPPAAPRSRRAAAEAGTTAYDAALSSRARTRVYPDVGDPGVDALHYGLDLTLGPRPQRLDRDRDAAVPRATDRRPRPARPRPPAAGRPRVARRQGRRVPARRQGPRRLGAGEGRQPARPPADLLRHARSRSSRRPTAPTSRPPAGPSRRDGTVWTMQEPYGAYSWYAVNDQPSDKAFYDVTIHAPEGQVGVANGRLRVTRTSGGRDGDPSGSCPSRRRRTSSRSRSGSFTATMDTGPHGLPISYWTPTDKPEIAQAGCATRRRPSRTSRARSVATRSRRSGCCWCRRISAMETQSMVTLGIRRLHADARRDRPRDRAPVVRRHRHARRLERPVDERGDGDLPRRGRTGPPTTARRASTRSCARWASPPTACARSTARPRSTDPDTFGEGNVYYIPALMWDTIRQRLGDDAVLVAGHPVAARPTASPARTATPSPRGGASSPART